MLPLLSINGMYIIFLLSFIAYDYKMFYFYSISLELPPFSFFFIHFYSISFVCIFLPFSLSALIFISETFLMMVKDCEHSFIWLKKAIYIKYKLEYCSKQRIMSIKYYFFVFLSTTNSQVMFPNILYFS